MNKEESGSQEFENEEPEVIVVCESCGGLYPCWCEHHKYKEYWRFVWEAMKNCKRF